MIKRCWKLISHAHALLIVATCTIFSLTACTALENAKRNDQDLNDCAESLAACVPVVSAQTDWQMRSSDARQAVAVDAQHVFAISDRHISKIDRASGKTVLQWSATGADSPVRHLNSAVVLDDQIYAAHSNWPVIPAQNSIEVWNAATLVPVESIRISGVLTWITWVDWYKGYWWAVLAHYDPAVTRPPQSSIGSTNSVPSEHAHDKPNDPPDQRTRLLRMNEQFRVLDTWYFPDALLQEFDSMSNSGGSWGPDEKLWLTGHSQPRAYLVRLPDTGNTLEWTSTVVLPDIEGQGIAWDRSSEAPVLFGVRRSRRELVKMRIILSDR